MGVMVFRHLSRKIMANANTKLVRVILAAMTRVEYTEIVAVPADITAGELDNLVLERYGTVDGGDYTDDPEYWERAPSCRAEALDPDDSEEPAFCATRDADGNLTVARLEPAIEAVPGSPQPALANQFMHDLLGSVETLSGIAELHGARTLADLMYLHCAILNGRFIDHYPGESNVLDLVNALPSARQWLPYIKVECLSSASETVPVNANLIPYRVNLHEESGDKILLSFECMAASDEHAQKLAERAHPGCVVTTCMRFPLSDARGSAQAYVVKALAAEISERIAQLRKLIDEPVSIQYAEKIDFEVMPVTNDNRILIGHDGWGCTAVNYTHEGLILDVLQEETAAIVHTVSIFSEDLVNPLAGDQDMHQVFVLNTITDYAKQGKELGLPRLNPYQHGAPDWVAYELGWDDEVTLSTRDDGQIFGIARFGEDGFQSIVPTDLAVEGAGYTHSTLEDAIAYLGGLTKPGQKLAH
jgi:hypothetical protein